MVKRAGTVMIINLDYHLRIYIGKNMNIYDIGICIYIVDSRLRMIIYIYIYTYIGNLKDILTGFDHF